VRREQDRDADAAEGAGVLGERVQRVGVEHRGLPGALEERPQELRRLGAAGDPRADGERVGGARRGEERLEVGAPERTGAGERDAHRLGPAREREREDLGARGERHEAGAAAQGAGEREVGGPGLPR
jgi:hypothetical protein